MTNLVKNTDLLLKEVGDPFAQENFLKLKKHLELLRASTTEVYTEHTVPQDVSQVNPVVGTWYLPGLGLSIPLSFGTYELGLVGLLEMTASTSVIGNEALVSLAFSTTTDVGRGILWEEVLSFKATTITGGYVSVPFSIRTPAIELPGNTKIYVHMRYRNLSGTPTVTLIRLRSNTASSPGKDPVIFARSIINGR